MELPSAIDIEVSEVLTRARQDPTSLVRGLVFLRSPTPKPSVRGLVFPEYLLLKPFIGLTVASYSTVLYSLADR